MKTLLVQKRLCPPKRVLVVIWATGNGANVEAPLLLEPEVAGGQETAFSFFLVKAYSSKKYFWRKGVEGMERR